MGWCMISNIILVIWDVPKAALLFSYYISYAGSAATPVLIVSHLCGSWSCSDAPRNPCEANTVISLGHIV